MEANCQSWLSACFSFSFVCFFMTILVGEEWLRPVDSCLPPMWHPTNPGSGSSPAGQPGFRRFFLKPLLRNFGGGVGLFWVVCWFTETIVRLADCLDGLGWTCFIESLFVERTVRTFLFLFWHCYYISIIYFGTTPTVSPPPHKKTHNCFSCTALTQLLLITSVTAPFPRKGHNTNTRGRRYFIEI